MRTTITIAPDVYAEVERLRREEGLGPSEALNALARRGLGRLEPAEPRVLPAPVNLGLKLDVTDIGAVIDLLDEDES